MSDDRIRAAMTAVDRRGFLPRRSHRHAGVDAPLSIGHGQTNSQPYTVAAMLELLCAHSPHRVLDVGAGSGWTAALLAHLVAPEGSVHAVEIVPALVRFGQDNLDAAGVAVTVEQATGGVFGLPDHAPFDRILVSAEATELPADLVDQLAPGGVIVIPVDGTMLRVVRHSDHVEVTRHGRYRFVPLLRSRD